MTRFWRGKCIFGVLRAWECSSTRCTLRTLTLLLPSVEQLSRAGFYNAFAGSGSNGIIVFVTAVRARGFTVAKRLGISKSRPVGKSVAHLEDRLDAKTVLQDHAETGV